MTKEEARYDIQRYIDNGCYNEDYSLDLETLLEATKALEKADKYKWHDLRENPDDLPEVGKRILYCFEYTNGMTYHEDKYRDRYLEDYKDIKHLAWKYYEPFEKEATK